MEGILKTELGKRLATLRKRAIVGGMRLLNEDEILQELKGRRVGRTIERGGNYEGKPSKAKKKSC